MRGSRIAPHPAPPAVVADLSLDNERLGRVVLAGGLVSRDKHLDGIQR